MKDLRKRFVEKIKDEPCLVCGRRGVDMAHLRAAGRNLGSAPRTWGIRSHKGTNWYAAIPLCKNCHETVHALGEEWLDKKLPGGRALAYAVSLRLLAELVEEG